MVSAETSCWEMEENSQIFNEDFYLPLYLPLWFHLFIDLVVFMTSLKIFENCATDASVCRLQLLVFQMVVFLKFKNKITK
jgi:hypothetical protein